MKKSFPAGAFFLLLWLSSCKTKNEPAEEPKDFFPVRSFLQSQVAQVDTSLFNIIKIEKTDSLADTSFVPREAFRQLAQEFTSIPDIASDDLKESYTETQLYDDALKRVVLSYAPTEKDLQVQRQDVTIAPSGEGGDVKTIYIGQLIPSDDSLVEKKMLWQVNRSFQIITTVTKPNEKPVVRTTEVVWNSTAPAK